MSKNKKIYFIAPMYLDRSPGQRFRFEQYLSYFERNGYDCQLLNIVNEREYGILYGKRSIILKSVLFFKFFLRRTKHFFLLKSNDLVFVFREAIYLGTTFFEYLYSKKAKMIYDFDDAIWIPNVSDANKKFEFLKKYNKIGKIISYSNLIIAGNQYLADYANGYNSNVVVIPTTVDTDRFRPRKLNSRKEAVCIGWSGSKTTVMHFRLIENVLLELKQKYGDLIYFKLIGESEYFNLSLNLKGTAWTSDTEVSELQEIDIGIMPLKDDKWSKGKCGLKGLTYMSLEIATVMSPVGVNSEIIQNGVNGFLANTEKEWIEYLSILVEDIDLRYKLGKEARKTVVEKYSVLANRDKYLEAFNKVLSENIRND